MTPAVMPAASKPGASTPVSSSLTMRGTASSWFTGLGWLDEEVPGRDDPFDAPGVDGLRFAGEDSFWPMESVAAEEWVNSPWSADLILDGVGEIVDLNVLYETSASRWAGLAGRHPGSARLWLGLAGRVRHAA